MTAHPAPQTARRHGWLAAASAIAGLAGFVALDLFVGLGGAGGSRTISAYIYTPGAWLFQSVIVLLIIGSLGADGRTASKRFGPREISLDAALRALRGGVTRDCCIPQN